MAMRTRLPSEVQVREIRPVSANFHALRSSFGKRYEYHAIEGWAFPQDNRFVHSLENRKVDLDAVSFEKGTDPFRGIEFMPGKGKQIDVKCGYVHGNLASRLGGVGM